MTETPRPLSLAFGGFAALAAAIGIGRFVYTPILPLMVADLGMTRKAAGLLASAHFLGYLLGALLATASSLPGSRRGWLLLALAASALTTGAMAMPSSQPAFMALRFAGGLASAFVFVFASALVLDRISAAGRSDLSVVHFAGVGAGIALSAIVVSVLSVWGGGWRSLWIANGLASVLAGVVVSGLIPNHVEPEIVRTSSVGRSSGRLPVLVGGYVLFGFGYVITATFLVAMVRGSEQIRAFEPSIWLLVGLTAAPSVTLWTSAGRRIGVAKAFALACTMEAVGVAASVLWLSPAGILLSAVLLGGTFMGITALGLVWARNLSKGDPRRTLAVMTAAFGLGQIVGPPLAGAVYDATGSFLLPSLAAASALLVAALLAVVGPGQGE